MANTISGFSAAIEEQLRKDEVDALIAEMAKPEGERLPLAKLLAIFIGFPRVLKAVDAYYASLPVTLTNG